MKINRPKSQKVWSKVKLECAVRLFLDGQSYEEISEVIPEFTPKAIESTLCRQGFTLKHRNAKLVGAVK